MARRATTRGVGSGEAWAFGPGTSPVPGQAVPVVESRPAVESQPAVESAVRPESPLPYSARDYRQPAVFLSEPPEPPAAERDMWDELPRERNRRSRRYVGKHRA